jgi:hypothetical protein
MPPKQDRHFGTEKLWTRLPADGTWRSLVPKKPGDFAYDDRSFWFRAYPGFSDRGTSLTVTGKRLDGPAPSFTWRTPWTPCPASDQFQQIQGANGRVTTQIATQNLTVVPQQLPQIIAKMVDLTGIEPVTSSCERGALRS